jgi:hypothetical protein
MCFSVKGGGQGRVPASDRRVGLPEGNKLQVSASEERLEDLDVRGKDVEDQKSRPYFDERGESMAKKMGIWFLVIGLCIVFGAGCATNVYKKMYPDYQARVQKLKDMGGEQKAPYETAKAENYLKIYYHEVYEDRDDKGAELFRGKLDQYLEQGMMKVQ